MPSIYELARLAGKEWKSPTDDTGSLLYRAWLTWVAFRAEARTNGIAYNRPGNGDVAGFLVKTTMRRMVGKGFPEHSDDDADSVATRTEIAKYLRSTKNVILLERDLWADEYTPAYWVRDDFSNVAPSETVVPFEPRHSEKKLTKAEAGEDRKPAPVMVTQKAPTVSSEPEIPDEVNEIIVKCPDCPFSASPSAVQVHRNKLNGREHSQQDWPCPFCEWVLTGPNALSLSVHYRRYHGELGHFYTCLECAEMFDSRVEQTAHNQNVHGKQLTRTVHPKLESVEESATEESQEDADSAKDALEAVAHQTIESERPSYVMVPKTPSELLAHIRHIHECIDALAQWGNEAANERAIQAEKRLAEVEQQLAIIRKALGQ